MAGFDFTFKCKEADRELGRRLLLKTQRLARNFDLEFRYSSDSHGWYISVNGPLTAMQALLHPIAIQLMPFGEGFPKPKNIRSRRRLVNRFIKEYWGGLNRIREMVEDISGYVGGTPNSYFFNEGNATHLAKQLREFERTLILYHNGLTSASQFAETAHTLMEASLKSCLPHNRRRGSFEQILNEVAKELNLELSLQQAIVRLKNRRKKAKHQGQRVNRIEMDNDVGDIVSALHIIFSYIRKIN